MLVKAVELLHAAKEHGIEVVLQDDDRLRLNLPKGQEVDNQLLAAIKEYRKSIIEFLQNEKLQSTKLQAIDQRIVPFDRSSGEDIPLSFAQERLWFIDNLQGSGQYHLPAVFRLYGKVNPTALEASFRYIINRHEVLRTVIREKNGLPYQYLLPAEAWQLTYIQVEDLLTGDCSLDDYIGQQASAPFQLEADFMLRVVLIRQSSTEHILVIVGHHIAFDGWSVAIMVRELGILYQNMLEQKVISLPELPLQYADYSQWQRQHVSEKVFVESLQYWKTKLEGVMPLPLLTDRPRPSEAGTRCGIIQKEIPLSILQQLEALSQQQQVILFITLLAAFKLLLSRYTGENDICVGTPVAGRSQQELEELIGLFANTLAVRTIIEPEKGFAVLLQQVKEVMLAAYQHQELPFEKIVEALAPERDLSRNPLFDLMFTWEKEIDAKTLFGDVRMERLNTAGIMAKFDIHLDVCSTASGLQASLIYRSDLYEEITMKRMLDHYTQLLESIISNPEIQVNKHNLITAAERNALLYSFNNTTVPAVVTSFIELFELMVQQSPDAAAVIDRGQKINYHQLQERVNCLAVHLQSLGIGRETIVPVCLNQSAEMIVALLGIAKAGGAWAPVDPLFPAERINFILDDVNATLVVTTTTCKNLFEPFPSLQTICVDEVILNTAPLPLTSLPLISPGQLAYLIYTSGSSGTPKGVMVEHGSLVNYVINSRKKYITNQHNYAGSFVHLSFTFDASLTALLVPLVSGKAVIIGSQKEGAVFDDEALWQHAPYDFIKLTPAHLPLLEERIQAGCTLPTQNLVVGGEALMQQHIDWLKKIDLPVEIINEYGPTEATVGCCVYALQNKAAFTIPESGVWIGKPMNNVVLYILEPGGLPAPLGIAGELCIGGVQVARGYRHLPQLTEDKFIADPFTAQPGARLYKSGDLARWLPNGNIEFLGRIDDQVKIRGYRIEPGEIENVLLQAPGVSKAVVVAKSLPNGARQLIGYVMAAEGFNEALVMDFLHTRLPAYMVPAAIVRIDSIPLTKHGKVNRKQLLTIDLPSENELVLPQTTTEKQLAAIWQRLLQVPLIGVHDNFFKLGGHSILATRLRSAIQKELKGDLPLRAIFTHPTIARLATFINGQKQSEIPRIERHSIPDRILLSYAQERLWFIDKLQGSTQYHIPWLVQINGPMDISVLEQSFRELICRHEILRTVIKEEAGNGYQYVQPEICWQLQYLRVQDIPSNHAGIPACIEHWITTPFDLAKDPMLRAWLISLSNDAHILVVVVHHIAFDGWSLDILIDELRSLYAAKTANHSIALPVLPVQYADYAVWHRQYMSGEVMQQKLEYWKKQLQGVEALKLPADFIRPAEQSIRGAMVHTLVDANTAAALAVLSKDADVTLFMTLLAVFNILMYRYTGQSDICVGTPVAGREQSALEGLIGFFVNTLALRCYVDGNTFFNELLQQIKQLTLDAYEHQDLPFEKVVEALDLPRDMSSTPVFNVLFTIQTPARTENANWGEAALTGIMPAQIPAKFDLSMTATETMNGLQLSIVYCSDLFKEATVVRMLDHYTTLLHAVINNAATPVGKLQMLHVAEENQLLQEFNGITADYLQGNTIIDCLQWQAAQTPDAIAVVSGERSITYRELEEYSNQLAHHLRNLNVKEGTLVPVCLQRSVEMITGILGIMKAGGAYIPIDPEFPEDRIDFLLKDTQAQIVVTSNDCRSVLPQKNNLLIVDLNCDQMAIASHPVTAVITSLRDRDLAYVMYTSGSTGKPKGVMIEHKSILNRLHWAQKQFRLDSRDAVLQKTTYCFDISVWELLWPLLNGARLVFARPDGHKDNEYLKQVIADQSITIIHFVPPMLETFLLDLEPGQCKQLRHVLCSGEALKPAHVRLFRQKMPQAALHNLYGPTEAAIEVTCWTLPAIYDAENVPIGKPIDNNRLYILNAANSLCPIGVFGELHIGGVQVARGYLNQPSLTEAKFINDPFSKEKGHRLYRTGDLARWLPDGNIEFAGRIDDQVKIRGYRIEPGEIAQTLEQAPGIQQAVVLVAGEQEHQYLAGFVTTQTALDVPAVMVYLQQQLPAYMIPSVLQAVSSIPMMPNGKTDRKQLLGLLNEKIPSKTVYTAPRNSIEENLVAIWKELLRKDSLGIHDDFFAQGGHSLLAIRLLSAIRKKLGRQVTIKDVFLNPTIAQLAACSSMTAMPDLQPLIRHNQQQEQIPLSFSQEQLWFVDRLQGTSQYHMSYVFRLKGKLNHMALELSFRTILQRHEVLRTVLCEEGKQVYQQIKPANAWTLQFVSKNAWDANDTNAYIWRLINTPFDLSLDYMLRVWLLEVDEEEYLLVTTVHHIAFDGWSISVMVDEFTTTYRALTSGLEPVLPELPVQYADYAIWQRAHLPEDVMAAKVAYWKQQLKDLQPVKLLTDQVRPAVQSLRGGSLRRILGNEWRQQLTEFSQQEGVTLFMTLLAAFKILLFRYTGQSDIAIGCPIAGRQRQELEGLIGFFVNTLVLRSMIDAEKDFHTFLHQVKQTTLDAYEHQEVPFLQVARLVDFERDLSRHPLVDIKFQLMNMPNAGELNLGDVQLFNENPEDIQVAVDINLFIRETPVGLQLALDYCRDLYNRETMERLLDHYEQLLKQLPVNSRSPVSTIGMLLPGEKQQLMYGFNRSAIDYPRHRTVIDLFDEQALLYGNRTALVFEQEQLGYHELQAKANHLAMYLLQLGVKREEPVVICVKRSIECIIGILAILKAGAAYVPVDDKHPDDRIAFILQDTGCRFCLADSSLKTRAFVAGSGVRFLDIRSEWNGICADTKEIKNINYSHPNSLMYIIYTSGSTGRPKGVMIEHRSLMDHVYGLMEHADLHACSSYALFASLVADAGHAILFTALGWGAVLYVLSDDLLLNNAGIVSYLQQNRIDCIKIVPSLWLSYVEEDLLPLPRQVIVFGGEAFPLKIKEILSQSSYTGKVYNHYGPTEATIGKCIHTIDLSRPYNNMPIGKPFSNTQLYVLDAWQNICPVGVAGELYIGGEGIARGYLNLPELTADKFTTDPFDDNPERKLYKTGDLVRWLPGGNIEYLGRKDDQIKIRGHRIEPGEIETVLNELPQVTASCVVARPDDAGSNRLIAYYVPDRETLRTKERALHLQQVAGWKELYETENKREEELADTGDEFSIAGWNNSFTGEPIPAEQMREWLDDIIATIFSGNPKNVLEVGSGKGLIYYQLAGRVASYVCTDFSNASIDRIRQRIALGARNYGKTRFAVCAAHEVSLEADEEVDTIVINSVVQYFPGEDYLSTVIDRCIGLLKNNGRIIIGDVRDNRLLPLFKTRLHLQKARESVSIQEFNWHISQELLKEEELCIAPGFFYALQQRHPGITHIDIQWKKGQSINELTLYRYTVVLYIGIKKELQQPGWQPWEALQHNNKLLQNLQHHEDAIAIKGVYNPRLIVERALEKIATGKLAHTVRDLNAALPASMEACKKENEPVNALITAALSAGYDCRFFPHEDPLRMNMLISVMPCETFIEQAHGDTRHKVVEAHTNIPLFPDISALIQKDLRLLLQQRLPDYMIPAEFVELQYLPLMVHGKVDRPFLTCREDIRTGSTLNYQAPQTSLEETLTTLWQDLLRVQRIGRQDNFFELGGHSLLATRVVSAIRKKLAIEVSVKDLFVHPTIASLAGYITNAANRSILPPVTMQSREALIPLSFAQERLWFIHKLQGSVQYHAHGVFHLSGALQVDAFHDAFREMVRRHEILRTVIREVDGKGYQEIRPASAWQWQYNYEKDVLAEGETLQQYIHRMTVTPFDLSNDWLFRVVLTRLSQTEHVCIVVLHHIASDGWSVSILVEELTALYHSKTTGTAPVLRSLPVQYADYALWQRKYLSGDILEAQLSYWRKQLEDVEPLQLHTDYPRPALQSVQGDKVQVMLPGAYREQINAIALQEGCTVFMFMLSVFNILLYRYTGQHVICVGTPIAGRRHEELEGLIGFFVNTLPLCNTVNGNLFFREFLQQVKQSTLDAYEYQELPFEKIVEALDVTRDMSRTPVFQHLFAYHNTPAVQPLNLGKLVLRGEDVPDNVAKFDISFDIMEKPEGLLLSMGYCTSLFKKDTIERMLEHYINLLQAIIENVQLPVGKLPMLSASEERQLLELFNDTAVNYPQEETLVDLFRRQVLATPHRVAAVFEDRQISYYELDRRSDLLARYLCQLGIKSECLVPVCLHRSLEMIIGIWGILKAGGAWVPIDPDYPAERIAYMLNDTAATVVISSKTCSERIPNKESFIIVEPDGYWEPLVNEQAIPEAPCSQSLAYVIYTSGSTGYPKGVLTEHGAVVNRLRWAQDQYKLTVADSVLQKTTFCFDVSVWELLWPLLTGARLVFARPEGQKDNEYLKQLIEEQAITLLHFVPPMLAAFLISVEPGDCKVIRQVLCSGEALSPSQVYLFSQKLPHAKLDNLYGPTEAAIDVTSWAAPADSKEISLVPIGRPVANTTCYLLNAEGSLSPAGAVGELHIGGKQVARGYLNKPALTTEKFVPDPFNKKPGARLYKTGDLARWLPDGNIAFIGRKDEQVKIRGFRIEPGEIENLLLQISGVHQAVTLVIEEAPLRRRLVAFVTGDRDLETGTLISYLQSKLPDYMVPSQLMVTDSIPLTANGKTDRKKLIKLALAATADETNYALPRNEREAQLADIWKQLLNVERVGVHDNFFSIGGDSIIVIQAVSRARQFGYRLQTRDFFQHQTIAALSTLLANDHEPDTEAGEQGVLQGNAGLLPIQQWFFEQQSPERSHYNQSVLLGINKNISAVMLTEAIQQILQHHDSLRFEYQFNGKSWEQRYGAASGKIEVEDLSAGDYDVFQQQIASCGQKWQQSLDIEKGILFRAVLIQTPAIETHNRLLLVVHHLAIDGVSWRILLNDLEEVLLALQQGHKGALGIKTGSYRQWYETLSQYAKRRQLLSQTTYWEKIISCTSSLPVDLELNEQSRGCDWQHIIIQLAADKTRLLLQAAPAAYNTEVNDLLLAALGKTMWEWTRCHQLLIGLEGHGREGLAGEIDTSRTVGWFTTIYPVLLSLHEAWKPDQHIKSVKEQLRSIPDKGLGYGVLKYICRLSSLQKRETWDVLFNYLGQTDNVISASTFFTAASEFAGNPLSGNMPLNYKLGVNGRVTGGELIMRWSFNKYQYKTETIQYLANQYIFHLEQLIAHCNEQKEQGAVRTPSDYGLTGIDFRELDQFIDRENSDTGNIMTF